MTHVQENHLKDALTADPDEALCFHKFRADIIPPQDKNERAWVALTFVGHEVNLNMSPEDLPEELGPDDLTTYRIMMSDKDAAQMVRELQERYTEYRESVNPAFMIKRLFEGLMG